MQYWKMDRHFSKKNGLRGKILQKVGKNNVTVMSSTAKNLSFSEIPG